MRAVCSFCGLRNSVAAANCVQCGASLADARRERSPLARPITWLPPLLSLAVLAAAYFRSLARAPAPLTAQTHDLQQLEADHTASLKKLDADFDRAEAIEEAKHRAWLNDKQITSGQQAAEHHAEEWKRRQNHDPAFAVSILERTLVDVEKLGKDSSLNAEIALKKVAELVAPPGSRIEVTPAGERFIVRVAFRMSAIHPNEAGSMTRHTSTADVRREIDELTTRLIRDLFDYCGSRGIERLSVSCNRAITDRDAAGKDRLVMRSLFRASLDAAAAAQIANWRSATFAQVQPLVKVEHDGLSTVTLQITDAPVTSVDPDQPLEF